ncbi:FAD dependent oxidoreductase [Celeribacter indicus]|uniref:FAD dependent oxidoreductase n=1 Tax=Celeribacter indicus TaxID=1208324 RepID=A0A0B5E0F4_9RHOB|nr:FAD dependent oxidoreductase [Celeribacter indicus]
MEETPVTPCETSSRYSYDVIVVGGGMAGCAAALAAARSGSNVLLVEQNAFLGGAATAGMVGQFVGWQTRAGRKVVGGVAEDIVTRLRADGGCGELGTFVMSTGHEMNRIEYDAQILKVSLEQMLIEAGVSILFKSFVMAARCDGDRIGAVSVWTAGRPIEASASIFIDASGDMALVTAAGGSFLGLGDDEALQPGTMMFEMAPVDLAEMDAMTRSDRDRVIEAGLRSGALPRAALHYSRVPGADAAWFNISRVSVDPDDPFSVSRGEIEGRRQAVEISRFLKQNMPGCSKARLSALAPQLGIRDTRRVLGDHVITRDEISAGVGYEDTVACGAYPIDVHKPTGTDLTFIEFGEDHHYSIPYRALVPAGFRNVLTAGRGVSATHEAFAALRVMPTAMAMGHAAGAGAALAATSAQGEVRAVSIPELQARLRSENAFLGV